MTRKTNSGNKIPMAMICHQDKIKTRIKFLECKTIFYSLRD